MSMILSPSMLSCDFNNIEKEMEKLKQNNIKYLHLDVMDGIFVKNISFGIPVIKSMSKIKEGFVFDTHLMITEPIRYVKNFIDAGADIITFHIEATKNVDEVIEAIKNEQKKVGIAINPDTDEKDVFKYLGKIDMVLPMGVYPGFGGQKYIEITTQKIRNLKKEILEKRYNVDIEVDGGITNENVDIVYNAGANIIVSGSYIFKGEISNNIKSMYKAVEK